MAPTDMQPWPQFIQERINLWDRLMAKYKADIAAKVGQIEIFIWEKRGFQEPAPIKITLPDGKMHEGKAWRTTPLEIAERISKGLADTAVISKVNGEVRLILDFLTYVLKKYLDFSNSLS